jgi:hypothetical protein
MFTYPVTDGWLRDLASEPTPNDRWPCIRWDDRLLADQLRFLDVEAELGVTTNVVWGLFVDRAWPVPLANVIDREREERLHAFVDAAHARGVKVLSGVGIYSWGFDEVIAKAPGVAAGHTHAMCPFREEAWEWQRRVLDFLMEPRWDLDGVSMQSADLGRCNCERCAARSPAEHHAEILVRSAEYVRAQRPEWVIGQASWGLRVDEPGELEHVRRISQAVDYMVEVRERTAEAGRRAAIVRELACAFGSVGGVFVEPPQHWERLRWFVPCGLGSARALARLREDGGRACEYFYRPFANPVEEVSWRTGARMLTSPPALPGAGREPALPLGRGTVADATPDVALREAVAAVYGVTGGACEALADWFARGEEAYFSRSDFQVGHGSLSLEPLIWRENPAASGPAVYLRDRLSAEARAAYAGDLRRLKEELSEIDIPNGEAVAKTRAAIDGTLREIAEMRQ